MNKEDRNGRVLLKFKIFTWRILRMLVEKYFLYQPILKPSPHATMEALCTRPPRKRWSLPPSF
jgi:hypothetical protein